MSAFVARVRLALMSAASQQVAFDPLQLEDLLPDLDSASANVEAVASTYCDDSMLYIYRVTEPGQPDSYLASCHGDGGVCIGSAGPFQTEAEAMTVCVATEGWTRL